MSIDAGQGLWHVRYDEADELVIKWSSCRYVSKLLDWQRLSAKPVMHNQAVCQVNTLLTLLNGSLKK